MSVITPPCRPFYDEATGFYYPALDNPDRLVRKADKRKRDKALRAARRLGTHTPEQWEVMLAFCGNACLACRRPSLRRGDTVRDHIVALACGGSDAIENLQPLCIPCNSRKRDRAWGDMRPAGWRLALQAAGMPT